MKFWRQIQIHKTSTFLNHICPLYIPPKSHNTTPKYHYNHWDRGQIKYSSYVKRQVIVFEFAAINSDYKIQFDIYQYLVISQKMG